MKRQIASQTLTTLAIAALLGSAVAPAQAYGWTSEQKRRLAFGIAAGAGWNRDSGVNGIYKTWDDQVNSYGGDYSQVLIKACGLSNTELSTVAPTWDPNREFLAAAAYIRGGSGSNIPASDCAWRSKIGTVNAQLNKLMNQRAALPLYKRNALAYRQQLYFYNLDAVRDMRTTYQSKVRLVNSNTNTANKACSQYGTSSPSCISARAAVINANYWLNSYKTYEVKTEFVRAATHLDSVNEFAPGYLVNSRDY